MICLLLINFIFWVCDWWYFIFIGYKFLVWELIIGDFVFIDGCLVWDDNSGDGGGERLL